MGDKTDELRDIFLDVADEETVTEPQEKQRGSVTDRAEEAIDERITSIVEGMKEKFTFETELSDGELVEIVRLFYDGADDDEVAEELSCSTGVVFRARMDLHLVREDDPPGIDADEAVWETVRERGDAADSSTLADGTCLDEDSVDRVRAVVEANERSRRVSQRFRTSFEELLTDADLTDQLAADAHRDGLEEATEDAEVDVDF